MDIPDWLRDLLTPDAPDPDTAASAEDALRGFSQGATLGNGDELSGWVDALGGDYFDGARATERGMDGALDERSPYERSRDTIRGQNREAAQRSPALYAGGQAVGGAMTLAPAAAMAPAAAAAGAGELMGGAGLVGGATGLASGFGHSEEDDLMEQGQDAFSSGIQGGVSDAATAGLLHNAGEIYRGAQRAVAPSLQRRANLDTLTDRGIPESRIEQSQRQNTLQADADALRPTRGMQPHQIDELADSARTIVDEPNPSIFDDSSFEGYGTSDVPAGAPQGIDQQVASLQSTINRPRPDFLSQADASHNRYSHEMNREGWGDPETFDAESYFGQAPGNPSTPAVPDPNQRSFSFPDPEPPAPPAPPPAGTPTPANTSAAIRLGPEQPVPWGEAQVPPPPPRRATPRGRAAMSTQPIDAPVGSPPAMGQQTPLDVANPDIRGPRDRQIMQGRENIDGPLLDPSVPGQGTPRPRLYDDPSGRPLGELGQPNSVMRQEVNRPAGGGARVPRQRMQDRLNQPEAWDRAAAGEQMRGTSRIVPEPPPEPARMGGRVRRQRELPPFQPPRPEEGTAALTNPGVPRPRPQAVPEGTMPGRRGARPPGPPRPDEIGNLDTTPNGRVGTNRPTMLQEHQTRLPIPSDEAFRSARAARGSFDAETRQAQAQLQSLQRPAPRPPEPPTPQENPQSSLLRQAAEGVARNQRGSAQGGQTMWQSVRNTINTPGNRARALEAVTPSQSSLNSPAPQGRWTSAITRATMGARPPEEPNLYKPPSAPKDLFDPSSELDNLFDPVSELDNLFGDE